MSAELIASLTIFVLAALLGFELISAPGALHTPLMSGTNAIHGDHPGRRDDRRRLRGLDPRAVLAFVAVVFGTVNVVGGFLVTDRMLDMFKRKPEARASRDDAAARASQNVDQPRLPRRRDLLHPRPQAA